MAGIQAKAARIGAAVALTAGLLSACGPAQDGSVLSPSFWSMSPLRTDGQSDLADLGLAELAKGNHVAAEGYFQKALKLNPKDVHALLGAGMLYQQTGQTTKAREMYEAVLALRPKETDRLVSLAETPKPLAEIANAGLGQIEGRPSTTAPGMEPPPGGFSGAPGGSLMLGRTQHAAMPSPGGPPIAQMRPLGPGVAEAAQRSSPIGDKFSGADANVVSRFTTLRTLREQGLVTAEEYNARRQANAGALLPLTSPPSSAGLDRPVPATDQIVGRLKAIGRALEMRALTVAQHASERAMILDALLPAAPVVVANPGVPPKEMMAAADAVRRIEFLRDGGLISAEEYARERKAVEIAMTPPAPDPLPPQAEEKPPAPMAAPAGAVAKAAKGGQAAVHLASYRSRQQADRGWQQIKRAHGEVLGNLEPEVSEVNLGQGKGTYYRLKVGPLADKKAAADMCARLKQRRQYCEPAAFDG